MTEALTLETWIGIAVAIIAFWGVASFALIKTMRQEERKLDLIERLGRIDTYSPKGLADLRAWIQANPDDPYTEEAMVTYNECVETLKEIDETFYEWDEDEIDALETID